MISTSPRQQVPITLKRLRPFSLSLAFEKSGKKPVDLTGSELRLVLAKLKRKGGEVLVTQSGFVNSPTNGLARFDIQGDDLDMPAGQYVLTATLTDSGGFESTIFDSEVEVEHNADPSIPTDYGSVIPPLSLTVLMREQNRITVRVNHVPDKVLYASAQDAAAAGTAAAAAAAAQAAAAAAAAAELAAQVAEDAARVSIAASEIDNFTKGDTGPPGEQGEPGEKGETGDIGATYVFHNTNGSASRPDVPLVYWVGSALPLNATNWDWWLPENVSAP
jgi:hypothetical protein